MAFEVIVLAQFEKFGMEIVVYDEIESFRKYDHPEF